MNETLKIPLTPQAANPPPEDDRTGSSVETLKQAVADNLFYVQGKFSAIATPHDVYLEWAFTVRDRLLHRWIQTAETYLKRKGHKLVCYLSAEYLLGPQLGDNLLKLDLHDHAQKAAEASGLDLSALLEQEPEPGLGNGGLGRLAACYLDSLSTLEIPAIGYGIRYEFGIFQQEIRGGWQVEKADKWLSPGNPWEIARPEAALEVRFSGRTEPYTDA